MNLLPWYYIQHLTDHFFTNVYLYLNRFLFILQDEESLPLESVSYLRISKQYILIGSTTETNWSSDLIIELLKHREMGISLYEWNVSVWD